jgi:bacillithiol system protein YtxJ
MREVRRFVEEHPEVSVFVIDVLAQRDLSDHVAARAGIRHESPQAIVLRRGSPVWSASHRGVTAAAIAQQIDSAS